MENFIFCAVSEPFLIKSFPFDSNSFDMNATRNILNATIKYVLSTKRFKEPLSKAVKKFSNKVVN